MAAYENINESVDYLRGERAEGEYATQAVEDGFFGGMSQIETLLTGAGVGAVGILALIGVGQALIKTGEASGKRKALETAVA